MSHVQKAMVAPINVLFKFLQSKTRVQIWLYEQKNIRLEGVILGFDEYMNVVFDNAVEIGPKNVRKDIGKILLKGENITSIVAAPSS